MWGPADQGLKSTHSLGSPPAKLGSWLTQDDGLTPSAEYLEKLLFPVH